MNAGAKNVGRLEMALWTLVMGWVVAGCGPEDGTGATGEARYPQWRPITAHADEARSAAPANVAAPRRLFEFRDLGNPVLSGIQSEHSPGTLWHSTARRVTMFGDLATSGLGGPTYLAYSSPTGITSLRPGSSMAGDQMRENWLLAGFAGATNWTEWDSPWAVFLQKRPSQVTLGTNEVAIDFDGAAGLWTMMPLYGVYRPPQQGREVLKAQGLKEKGMLTWEWPTVVARDPLTRLRYWAGATRRFPILVTEDIQVDTRPGTVTLREHFEWLEIPDAWATRPIRIAPVSPGLALVMTPGQTFPVESSKAPFDFEIPTVYGPFFGVPETDEVAMSFRVLGYVNEAETVGLPGKGGVSVEVDEAVERLRREGRELFPSKADYRPEGGGGWGSLEALEGYLWQARALAFFDAETRPIAVASLRQAMWERVLGGLDDAGSAGGTPAATSALMQAVWAVAHATDGRERVRERWPLLCREFTRHKRRTWAGFGPGETEALGDGAAPAIAFARLAWLAGDLEAYRLGCGSVAREFALLYGRLRGGRWFREQQPWRTMEAMPETVAPRKLLGGGAGWEIVGPGYPTDFPGAWPGERWLRFRDWDVARFCRDYLAAEVRAEAGWMERVEAADGGVASASVIGLMELGFVAHGRTNQLTIQAPSVGDGKTSAILARCLAVIRAGGSVRRERLIAAVDMKGGEGEAGHPTSRGHLIQSIDPGRGEAPEWPRVRFVEWPTPVGTGWEVGEVRAGEAAAPVKVRRVDGRWETRWDFEMGP